MPRLLIPYARHTPPCVALALRAQGSDGRWGAPHKITAVVRSGAPISSFRSADADALGLSASRAPGPPTRLADGSEVASEALTVPIVAKLMHPSTGEYWGPTFQLWPTIKTAGERVLGTGDFFHLFDIGFTPDPRGGHLSLAY